MNHCKPRNHSPFALAAVVSFALYAVGATLPSTATAADVFKCTVGGKTVYQNSPCTGADDKPYAVDRGAPAERDPSTYGALDLFEATRAATDESRAASDAYRQEMAELRSRPGGQSDTAAARRIADKYAARAGAADRRAEALHTEITHRCPKGASLIGGHLTCVQ